MRDTSDAHKTLPTRSVDHVETNNEGAEVTTTVTEPIAACPYHKESQVIETATHFVCKEDGCKLSVPREICKRELVRDEAVKLFTDNSTDPLEGFTSKAGKPFAATLYLKRSGRHGFRFQNRD